MGEKTKEALRVQFDKRLRLELTEVAPTYLRETRGGRNVQHELVPLLRQSVYSRLAGYEDTNDALRLAKDPAMQAVVGRRALEKQAASTNALSRFETEVLITEENQKGLEQMNAAWVGRAMMRTRHQTIILDMDSSESPVYGEQEGAAYNGHFQSVCYHPLSPVIRYHDFQYQAKSWDHSRRVVAKVEWHRGELFPRVGFIVTNLSAKAKGVVHFYNGRGTAEQWIKEGKYALNWTRLSCHRLVANQVRLHLFVLAYNLGNFLRWLGLPKAIKDWSLRSLQVKLIKMGGRIVRHGRQIVFQLAEVAVPRELFAAILERISRLRLTSG